VHCAAPTRALEIAAQLSKDESRKLYVAVSIPICDRDLIDPVYGDHTHDVNGMDQQASPFVFFFR
jgi:hypothetical protein